MKRSIWLHAVAATAFLALGALAQAGEVPFKQVPKSVQQAVMARFKGAKVVGAAREKTPEDSLIYEVSLKEKGKGVDVTLTPAGDILSFEKEISFKDLPQAAADSLNQRYPGARYKILETFYKVEGGKETLAYYEALFTDSGKQAWMAEFAGDGTILKAEMRKSLEEEEE